MKSTAISSPLRCSIALRVNKVPNSVLLNFNGSEEITVNSRLEDIKFPSIVSNSPYSMRSLSVYTEITSAMEL